MVVPCLVNSLNIFTYYGGFNQHSLWYRKLDYQQYIWALFFHSILLIFEKWNKSVLSVWIFYSPGFYSHYMSRHQRIPLSKMFWSWNTSFECECWERSWDCRQSNARANNPVVIFLFKFSNKNIETLSENSSKVTKKIPEWHCYCYTVFYSFTPCFCVFIADFDQVNTNWERPARHLYIYIYKTNFRSFWKEEKYS